MNLEIQILLTITALFGIPITIRNVKKITGTSISRPSLIALIFSSVVVVTLGWLFPLVAAIAVIVYVSIIVIPITVA